MAKRDSTKKFVFRRHDNIGSADAEEDSRFLAECFVDTGDLSTLRDITSPKRLILGRTGSGKSALLIKLADEEERTIQVRPESLALSYISNSTILQFFSDLGVSLDIFFRLLWRHVFTVELLKYHFKIETEEAKQGFIEKICNMFKDKKHIKAIEYLRKWGESFWEETEYRIKEVTTTLEEDLKAAAGSNLNSVTFSVEGAKQLSEEQRSEVVQRAQKVVNQVQIRQLSDILELINDVLNDHQKRYYIIIDRLDEDWIEDTIRLRLIRALIETIKDFGRVKQVKIIAAIRFDLLDRVFRKTRDAGFQEEKYESLYLPVEWTKKQMISLVDERLNFLIKQRYTKQKVNYKDILPSQIDNEEAIEYILDRTTLRPRDMIMFINACLERAENRAQFTASMIRESEAQYSAGRIRSLADEWAADYPLLIENLVLLRDMPANFEIASIDNSKIETLCLDLVTAKSRQADIFFLAAFSLVEGSDKAIDFLRVAFQAFHRIGIVGLKIHANEPFLWIGAKRRLVSKSEIHLTTKVTIHPAYWRALGVYRERDRT